MCERSAMDPRNLLFSVLLLVVVLEARDISSVRREKRPGRSGASLPGKLSKCWAMSTLASLPLLIEPAGDEPSIVVALGAALLDLSFVLFAKS